MRVSECASAAQFLLDTDVLRGREPILTNLLGSIAQGAAAGRRYAAELWLVIRDDQGAVVGCALRTAPWNLLVSPMPRAAARALGRSIRRIDPEVPGVTGPRGVVDDFVDGLAPAVPPQLHMHELVRVLDTLSPPTHPARGSGRRARPADVGMLTQWQERFATEVGLPSHESRAAVEARILAGTAWIWEADGDPVAMGGHAPLVPTPIGLVGRIGPIYTTPTARGQGFGASITALIAESLLERCTMVMLLADADNPGSNSIYAQLGFVVRGELVEMTLPLPMPRHSWRLLTESRPPRVTRHRRGERGAFVNRRAQLRKKARKRTLRSEISRRASS